MHCRLLDGHFRSSLRMFLGNGYMGHNSHYMKPEMEKIICRAKVVPLKVVFSCSLKWCSVQVCSSNRNLGLTNKLWQKTDPIGCMCGGGGNMPESFFFHFKRSLSSHRFRRAWQFCGQTVITEGRVPLLKVKGAHINVESSKGVL